MTGSLNRRLKTSVTARCVTTTNLFVEVNGGYALGLVIGKVAYANHYKIMSIEDLSVCLFYQYNVAVKLS